MPLKEAKLMIKTMCLYLRNKLFKFQLKIYPNYFHWRKETSWSSVTVFTLDKDELNNFNFNWKYILVISFRKKILRSRVTDCPIIRNLPRACLCNSICAIHSCTRVDNPGDGVAQILAKIPGEWGVPMSSSTTVTRLF